MNVIKMTLNMGKNIKQTRKTLIFYVLCCQNTVILNLKSAILLE